MMSLRNFTRRGLPRPRTVLLVASLFAGCLAGCSSQKLSRDTALAVINTSTDMRLFSTVSVRVTNVIEADCDTLRTVNATMAELEREGLLAAVALSGACRVSLTQKGEKVVHDEGWTHTLGGDGLFENRYPVVNWRLGRYKAVEITGISQDDERAAVATVTFAFREELTERGARTEKAGAKWPPLIAGTSVATLRRFDDGWRVETVNAKADAQ